MAGQRQGRGKGSFPEGGFSPRRRHPMVTFFSFSHSTRVMFVHGEWAIEKGGVPASFGRYGAQRHHFETAHSIRVAPTDFHRRHGPPTLQLASLIKNALRPVCAPSPCKEWKLSTTGRVGIINFVLIALVSRKKLFFQSLRLVWRVDVVVLQQ